MPRPTYLPTELYDSLLETSSKNRAASAIQGLGWQSKLDDAIAGLQQTYDSAFQPMPIVVSDRPDARAIQQQQALAAPMPTTPLSGPPPTPETPSVPAFSPEDFVHEDGVTTYRPSAMPQISAGAQAASNGVMPTGEIDNSSREAFVRTAYPWALKAAGGDAKLAQQLIATAISENGKVGTGRSLGEMGFNVGGIQGVEGPAGSFTALDAGRPRQFAAYNDLSEGFRAVKDLVSSGRYADAAANYRQTGDIDRYWREVNEAGYSETPDWQDKVGSIRRTQVEPLIGQQAPRTQGQQQAQAPATVAARIVPNAAQDSYWTSEGTHGGAPAADIFAPAGSPIYAPVSGTSEPAVYPSGGNATTIKGDDGRYYYMAHGNVPFRGGRIEAGQPIGEVGTTGNAQGGRPHVHYAIASNPAVFGQKNGSGDIEGDAYWTTPAPNAGAAQPSAPAIPSSQGTSAGGASTPPADASPLDQARATYGDAGDTMRRQPLGQQPELPYTDDAAVDAVAPGAPIRGTDVPAVPFAPGDGGAAPMSEPATYDVQGATSGGPPPPDAQYAGPFPTTRPVYTADGMQPSGGAPTASGSAYPEGPAAPAPLSVDVVGAATDQPNRGPSYEAPVAPRTEERAFSARSSGETYLDQSIPSPPGWQALVDGAGNVVDWVRERVQGAADTAYQALEPARQAAASLDGPPGYGQVQSAGPGEPDYVSQGGSVIRALQTPIKPPSRPEAPPNDPSWTPEQRAQRTAAAGLAGDVADIPYQAAEGGRQAIMEAAQSFADALRAGEEGRPLAAAGNALWSALQVAGLPWTEAQKLIDQMLPEANIMGVGPGIMVGMNDLVRLGASGINALKRGSGALTADRLAAAYDAPGNVVRGAGAAIDAGIDAAGPAVRAGARAIGEGARGLAEEGARQLMDLTPGPRVIQEGGGSVQRPTREIEQSLREQVGPKYPDVRGRIGDGTEQTLGQESAEMLRDSRMPRDAVHPDLRAEGIGPRITPQVETSSRLNAGLPFDPASAAAGAAAGSQTGEDGETDPLRAGAGMLFAGVMGRKAKASPSISRLGQRVMETYARVTPARVEASTARALQIASDAIASKIPRRGGLDVSPSELIRTAHEAIVKNLQDTKTVMTGIRPGAIEAYLRGEGLTSKFETRDLDTINRITQGQVNVAGGRAGKPYTIAEAADFAQRESEQMRVATGGTRFPDPVTGAVDEEAPRVMYAYVSEGQPLVGPNRPTAWLVWDDDTPRVTSAHHPYGLTSPGQDIHASMPPGLKAAIWADDAVKGGRAVPGPGGQPLVTGWETEGIRVGPGRKIADTNWLVGPEGEDAMRANGLVMGMSQDIQRAIATGQMTDPEQIAAVLMRGGSPKWKSGWAAVMNPSRSESLVLDPSIEKVKAIYITGTPKSLAAKIPNTGGMTELQVAQKIRADILDQHGKDVPILFTDISQGGKQNPGRVVATAMSDAQVLEGQPLALAPGRSRIVDQYTQAIDPTTKKPYMNLGSDLPFDPASAAAGGAAGAMSEDEEGNQGDPLRTGLGTLAAGILRRRGGTPVVNGIPVRRLAQGIQQAAAAGKNIPNPVAGLPHPLPNAKPGWWDWAQTWRYGVGLFGQTSTALMQLGGGLGEVALGAPTEALRQGVIRGHPEHLPLIAWEGLKSVPAGLKSAGETVVGKVPAAVLQNPDYRPPLSGRLTPGSVGQKVALGVETPGRIATQAPDALWYEVFHRTGIAQAAAEAAQKQLGSTGSRIGSGVGAVAGGTYGAVTAPEDATPTERLGRAAMFAGPAALAGRGIGNISRRSVALQQQLIKNPTPEILARAKQLADDATYKGDLGALGTIGEVFIKGPSDPMWQAITKGMPPEMAKNIQRAGSVYREIASHFMPVYHTVARITEGGLGYLPGVGMLPPDKVGLAAKPVAMDERLAKQATGLMFTMGLLGYAASGGVRGPGPKDLDVLQEMRDTGYETDTVNIGGLWVQNASLGRMGTILNTVGAINDAMLYGDGKDSWTDIKENDPHFTKQINLLVSQLGRAYSDYPTADALKSILKLGSDPTTALSELAGEVGAQYVPGLARTVATATDTKARRPDRDKEGNPLDIAVDTFKQRSGIGRQDLPAATNRLGEDVENQRQGWAAILPRVGADRPDAVIQSFIDNKVEIPRKRDKLTIDGLEIRLPPPRQREWQRYMGEYLRKEVPKTLRSAFWSRPTTTLGDRGDELRDLVKEATEDASGRLEAAIPKAEVDRLLKEAERRESKRRGEPVR